MIDRFDIYISGVGGQGIGLLSEALIRAIDYSGQRAIGADTHGLAQRGGIVVSHLRIGKDVNSVLIRKFTADLVVSLERHEALRSMQEYLKDEGSLIYYNAVWQPLEVRLMKAKQITDSDIFKEAEKRNIKVHKIFDNDLKNPRMQNIVLLSNIVKYNLVPGLDSSHCISAIKDLMKGLILKQNLEVFEKILNRNN